MYLNKIRATPDNILSRARVLYPDFPIIKIYKSTLINVYWTINNDTDIGIDIIHK